MGILSFLRQAWKHFHFRPSTLAIQRVQQASQSKITEARNRNRNLSSVAGRAP
jgi:hypothetical protein